MTVVQVEACAKFNLSFNVIYYSITQLPHFSYLAAYQVLVTCLTMSKIGSQEEQVCSQERRGWFWCFAFALQPLSQLCLLCCLLSEQH